MLLLTSVLVSILPAYGINNSDSNLTFIPDAVIEFMDNYSTNSTSLIENATTTLLGSSALTGTGFAYPTGLAPTERTYYGYNGAYKYYSYAGWLARSDTGNYPLTGYYHIGQDIPAAIDTPVYPIADGEIVYVSVNGWNYNTLDNNYGLLVKHKLNDGTEFLALYGHIRPNLLSLRYTSSGPVNPPVKVYSSVSFATVGPYGDVPHLHFGIHPGLNIPSSMGILPLSQWPDKTQSAPTNGFVNPIVWIETHTPFSSLGWKSLGGYITSSPSVIVDNLGKTEFWVKGGDNALWVNIDGTWRGKGGVLTSDPFAVKDYNGKIHILVRGSDYAVWDFIYDPAVSTGHWKYLGGYVTSGPTGAMEPTYHNFLKVLAIGLDNALWQCNLNINTEATEWKSLGGFLTSGPYAIFDPAGRLHIFVRGGDNALWDCEGIIGTDSNLHFTWSCLGGRLLSRPTACIEPNFADYIAVFAKGGDNGLWMCDVNSAATGTWYSLGGVISSDPFAVADTSANKIHVFVRGSDSALWKNIFSTDPWNPGGKQWQGIGGSILTYTPGATPERINQAFVIGTDHALWRNSHTTPSTASSDGNSTQKQEESNQVNYPAGDSNSGR